MHLLGKEFLRSQHGPMGTSRRSLTEYDHRDSECGIIVCEMTIPFHKREVRPLIEVGRDIDELTRLPMQQLRPTRIASLCGGRDRREDRQSKPLWDGV